MLRTKVRSAIVLFDLNNISVLFSDGGGDSNGDGDIVVCHNYYEKDPAKLTTI